MKSVRLVSLLVFVISCLMTPIARSSPRDVAIRFVKTINSGNVKKLQAQAEPPFLIREQEWDEARHGRKALGTFRDQKILNKTELDQYLKILPARLKITGKKPFANPLSDDVIFITYLKESPPDWKKLKIFQFLRGQGSVEHSVLIGVDTTSGKVRGIYSN